MKKQFTLHPVAGILLREISLVTYYQQKEQLDTASPTVSSP